MKTQVLIMVLLIVILSGCTDSRVYGLYVNDRDNDITLNFMDDGKVISVSKNSRGVLNTVVMDYRVNEDTVITTFTFWTFVLKIQDNGKTLVTSEGGIYRKVNQ